MRPRLLPILALLALAAALAGCGRSSQVNSPTDAGQTSTDQALVASVIAGQSEVVDDGQFEGTDAASLSSAAPAGALAAIEPLRFWREITSQQRTFEYAFADSDSTGRPTRAVVTVHRRLLGSFAILAGVSTGDAADTSVIRKPLDDRWVRRLALARVPGTNRWHIVATSGVRVTAKDAATHIVSLRVQDAGVDTTITEPLALFRLREVLRLQPGTTLTLTVATQRNDDVVVLCRLGHRLRFVNNGDNTYTGTWTVPDPRLDASARPRPGVAPVFHLGVNALSHGTLFDDTAAYDSQAWILPAVLAPELIAEQLP
jgi:hypothetical protein